MMMPHIFAAITAVEAMSGEFSRAEEGGRERKEKKDICCGKTFLPASNSLALMKSWDRERGKEGPTSCFCCCRSHALCYLTLLRRERRFLRRKDTAAADDDEGGRQGGEGDVRSVYTATSESICNCFISTVTHLF